MTDAFDAVRKMTPETLAGLGQPKVAFVKPIESAEGLKGFGIFSAIGLQVGVAPTRETASIAVRQHEMQPVNVH